MCVEKSHIQKQIFEKDRNNSKVKWKIVFTFTLMCTHRIELHCSVIAPHRTTVIVVDALLFKHNSAHTPIAFYL